MYCAKCGQPITGAFCSNCGAAAEAQPRPRPASQKRGGKLGLVLVGLLALFLIPSMIAGIANGISSEPSQQARPEPKAKYPWDENPAAYDAAEKIFLKAQADGAFEKFDCGTGHVFIRPANWNSVDYESKVTVVQIAAMYCGRSAKRSDLFLRVRDSMTGNTFATYHRLTGVKLEK